MVWSCQFITIRYDYYDEMCTDRSVTEWLGLGPHRDSIRSKSGRSTVDPIELDWLLIELDWLNVRVYKPFSNKKLDHGPIEITLRPVRDEQQSKYRLPLVFGETRDFSMTFWTIFPIGAHALQKTHTSQTKIHKLGLYNFAGRHPASVYLTLYNTFADSSRNSKKNQRKGIHS